MYGSIVKKLEKIFVFLVIYIVPIVVITMLVLMYFSILPLGEMQERMSWSGITLLAILLGIKPLSIICKRDFQAVYRTLPEGIHYLLKGRTTDPIWKYIKNLILHTVYSLSLYGLRLRKWIGILTFWMILSHRSILEIRTYHSGFPLLILSNNFFIWAGISGLFALLVGFLTSNMWSMKKLKRRWKPVQQIAYLAFLGACIHIYLWSHERGYLALFGIFLILKIRERWPQKKTLPTTSAAPVVQAPELMKAKIINRKLLTHDVLELTLEVHKELTIIPGQRALFTLQDAEGTFNRSYSIVDYDIDEGSTLFVLAIRLFGGRSTTLLSQKKIGEELLMKGVYGKFVLQNTDAPKVFIATGTGIAPLINMAKRCENKHKKFYFSVPEARELFYEDRLKEIPDLPYEIHITRENVPGYAFGRLDLDKADIDPKAEIYVCGNPKVVEAIVEELKTKGYQHIFSEKF